MCDIWRIRQAREITAADLAPHLDSLRALQVRWIVFSGGEPQLHRDLASLVQPLRTQGVRLTLLTAGLLLAPQAGLVAGLMDDVIVSLDGPPEVHDRIRNVPRAFERMRRGVEALRKLRPDMRISARCTVQKANHHSLRRTVDTARELDLKQVSFLAADLTSEAFNRPQGWTPERQSPVALTPEEIELLDDEIEALIHRYQKDIAAGFIAEGPAKLRRIVGHFRAHIGQVAPKAPRCNAPWVSTVIEADGTVRPCFFHRPIGNIHDGPLLSILNGDEALRFRRNLDIATDPVCSRCVCSLYLPPDATL
jgi:MoaA/NifB/PqqE/SkfB family radical SAM enzyme